MKTMKFLYKTLTVAGISGLIVAGCNEPEFEKPNTVTDATDLKAKFLFVNASPDAPELDFFVNNEATATGIATGEHQDGYAEVTVSGAGIGVVNLKADGTSGDVGGMLGSNAVIYRAGNNNSNNFSPAAGANYTVFAVDSINRPRPIRTVNERTIAGVKVFVPDVTYFSYRSSFTAPKKVGVGDTTINLATSSSNSQNKIDTVRRYNNNNLPSFIVPVGTVPLGATDVGGVRFLLLQDVFPSFASTNVTQSAIRFVNLSANAGGLHVRLEGTTDVTIAANAQYALSVGGGFNPSVGSRTVLSGAPAAFTLQTTANAGTANTYNVEVSTNAGFTNIIATLPNVKFEVGKVYTIYTTGFVGGTGAEAFKVDIVEHN